MYIIFLMLDLFINFFNFIIDGIDFEDYKFLVNFFKENDMGKCLNNNIV